MSLSWADRAKQIWNSCPRTLSQELRLPYPIIQHRARRSWRGQLTPNDGTSQARERVDDSRAAGGLGPPLPSSLPEDQGEGSLAYMQWHLPTATISREQVLLFPGMVPRDDNQPCLHTAFCDVSHVEKPKVPSSKLVRKNTLNISPPMKISCSLG